MGNSSHAEGRPSSRRCPASRLPSSSSPPYVLLVISAEKGDDQEKKAVLYLGVPLPEECLLLFQFPL